MNIKDEQERMTKLLKGKKIKTCIRNSEKELLIEFEGGERLFINYLDEDNKLDFSITE